MDFGGIAGIIFEMPNWPLKFEVLADYPKAYVSRKKALALEVATKPSLPMPSWIPIKFSDKTNKNQHKT